MTARDNSWVEIICEYILYWSLNCLEFELTKYDKIISNSN